MLGLGGMQFVFYLVCELPGSQHLQSAGGAKFMTTTHGLQMGLRGMVGGLSGLQRAGIRIQRLEHIRDIAQRLQDSLTIVARRRVNARRRRLRFGPQTAAQQRLGQLSRQSPDC